MELENSYLLYGHLGGVVYLATNTIGDTLVSVGQDRVAKVWTQSTASTGQQQTNVIIPVLHPVRWVSLNYNISAVSLSSDTSRYQDFILILFDYILAGFLLL